jgi:hypothetical protein
MGKCSLLRTVPCPRGKVGFEDRELKGAIAPHRAQTSRPMANLYQSTLEETKVLSNRFHRKVFQSKPIGETVAP